MVKKAAERRKHPRQPVNIRIKYKVVNQFFEDYIKNISLGGIFVATSDPLPVRTKLRVQFSLPDLKTPIETEGIVVHTIKNEGTHGPQISGMGIRFSALSPENKTRLEAYLADTRVV